jgi:uncharacterized protein (TIGR00730 family)
MNRAKISNVCVYCGSNSGKNPRFAEAARTLGKMMAEARIGLVYGGGGNGLMGEVASAARAAGGKVTGIIPEALTVPDYAFLEVDEYIVVDTLHKRKMLMFERVGAFVALPGGMGTLEELVEQLTWVQLGIHDKPIILANVDGYWDKLLTLFDHMRDEGFLREGASPRYSVVDRVEEIVPLLLRQPPLNPAVSSPELI